MNGTVECYSGVEYAQRPERFRWQGVLRTVARICAERILPEGKQFEVEDSTRDRFLLTYETARDLWTIRAAPCGGSNAAQSGRG
jgi:hypothetical protein